MTDSGRPRRELFVAIVSILMTAAAVYVCYLGQVLWVLVPIPAAIGVVYHLLNLSSRYASRRNVVDEYRAFTMSFDRTWSGRDDPQKVSEDLSDDLEAHAPTLASMVWAAALLTSVFAIPAIVSHGSLNAMKGLTEAQRGIVFSGLGVWVLIVFRTIGRINAGGLNARFLITASLRAAVAMMLGYFAGAVEYFREGSVVGPTAYFLVGIAYPMFYDSLLDKASKLFGREKPVTKELPLKMIDGVDDDTADILTELNIASVQHMATSDAGVLTVRSLFPFGRVVDWIDQAILITYFREGIVTLRTYGVRGSIDFVSMMEPIVKNTTDKDEAAKTLAEIAGKLGIPSESLYTLGLSIYYDYRVNLLARLWQHSLQADGYTTERAKGLTPSTSEQIPIGTAGAPSFSAFVNDRVEAELRREAAERAARFREQNPDASKPSEADMKFDEAYAAAQQRATVGASPKPSARTKDVYEQAFLGALG
jgi:hypothetical protein